MKSEGGGCYSVTRQELLDVMRREGSFLWWGKFGPHLSDSKRRELHPRRDTVTKLLRDRILVPSDDANKTQRECGMSTYRLAVQMNEK